MTFDSLTPTIGFIGSIALVILAFAVVKLMAQMRRLARNTPGAAPSRTMSAMVIAACIIAMACAALRAWQFSLIGH